MVSRYFILSGIPLNRTTIGDEIQKMISFLLKNLQTQKFSQSQNSNRDGAERLRKYLIKTRIENLNYPDWNIFEFITKKGGRRGPSKKECIEYYNDKLVFKYYLYISKIMKLPYYIKNI